MPILKSAIKKLRKDKKRTVDNKVKKALLKRFIKKAVKTKSLQSLKQATSFIDKMAKVHLIHKNKASKLKSRLSRLKITRVTPAKTPLTK